MRREDVVVQVCCFAGVLSYMGVAVQGWWCVAGCVDVALLSLQISHPVSFFSAFVMRILAGLIFCVALASAIPEPQGGGLFRGRKIGGRLSANNRRQDNTFDDKPSRRPAVAQPTSAAPASQSARITQVDSSCSE
ncbi:hypothetical protein Pcinc_026911, partial [Petrolisthes cinctipes]